MTASRLLLVATVLFVSTVEAQTPSAKAMFYDPINGTPASENDTSARLRPVVLTQRFPPRGDVGIHYWLEDAGGRIFSEIGAASARGPFQLHIRSNVGGFLTVLSLGGDGASLTERTNPKYPGLLISRDSECVVPAKFEFSDADSAPDLIIVFSRSQTEQVSTAWGARRKLEAVLRGYHLVRQTEERVPGEIGTYVVDPDGGPVMAEISMRSR